MVYWVTKGLGIKAANEELTPDEYGSIIIDVRDITDGKQMKDGQENFNALAEKLYAIKGILATRQRTIIQCQAGVSRSPSIVAAMLVYATSMDWEDVLDIVKKKCPRTQINQDLLDQLKKVVP
jgi:protein-tyrosine phosphatase